MCIFCAIVGGEAPCLKVAESDAALAFLDISPATTGHTLVIPKRHSPDLLEMPEEDLRECTRLAQAVAAQLMQSLSADGINLVNACRPAAWQTVFHFHWHVVPRYAAGDGLSMPWVPRPGDPEQLRRTWQEITGS